jgi:hypothetical protein
MTLEEIENVEEFSIENEFGKIQWPGKTNLVGLNLDLLVSISQNVVEVYPDDMFSSEEKKPMKGKGLNKKAVITFYNIEQSDDIEDFEEHLKKIAEEQNCNHIKYDEKEAKWTFEVDHFSLYRFFDENEENLYHEKESEDSFLPQ